MTSHLRIPCALVALAAGTLPAHAAPIVTGDTRFAESAARLDSPAGIVQRTDQRGNEPGAGLLANVRSGLGFGLESGGIGSINTNSYQSSWLVGTPEQFAGTRFIASVLVSPVLGTADNDSTLSGAARSLLDLRFSLDSPAAFAFDLFGTLRPDTRFGTLGNAGISAELSLDEGDSIFLFSTDLSGRSRPTTPRFAREGTLPAGDYRLRLELWGTSNWPTAVSGNVDSTFAVPAPSAMGLLGLGLLFAGPRRRK